MENVIKNMTAQQRVSIPYDIPEPKQEEKTSADENPAADSDKPVHHVRAPLLRRRGNVLLMGLAAVCGAACGGAMAFGGTDLSGVSAALPMQTEGSFLMLFLGRLIYGGVFLLAEYILGYFALGEWLVWAVPLCCGMGSALTMASAGTDYSALLLLPSASITLALTVFGANTSGELSSLLLRLASGKSSSVVMTNSAAKDYTLRFMAYLAVLAAAGIYEAAVKLGM